MPETAVARRGRSASMGALLAFAGGLALYQMTSLVLGPGGSRQLALSLNIPSVDVEELAQPVVANMDFVVGTLAAPAAPLIASPAASRPPLAAPKDRSTAAGPVPATKGSMPGIAPAPTSVASPATGPAVRPEPPVVRATPPVQPTQDPSRY